MGAFILIMILAGDVKAPVTAEFSSYETCEVARKHIEQNREGNQNRRYTILSQGCFKK